LRHVTARPLRAQLDGYLQRVVEDDVEESGLRVRRPDTLRRWLTAYAAATATTASYERIRDAATSGVGDKPARTTTGPYVEVLERLWILDRVDAWSPARTPLSRLSAPPKQYLVGPALSARLLGVGVVALLEGHEPSSHGSRAMTTLASSHGCAINSARTCSTRPSSPLGQMRTGDPTASPSCPPQSSGRSPARSIRPRYGSSSRPRRFETDHRTTSQCGAARRPRRLSPAERTNRRPRW
jgi:uncharacterized protein